MVTNFESGFEIGNLSEFNQVITNGTLAATKAVRKSGLYSCLANIGIGAGSRALVQKYLSPTLALSYLRFYAYFITIPSDYSLGIIGATDGTGSSQVKVYSGSIYLIHTKPSWVQTYYNITLELLRWYCFEIKTLHGSLNGEARLYLDGTEIIALTGIDTTTCSNAGSIEIGIGWHDSTYEEAVHIDDIKVADEYIGLISVKSPMMMQVKGGL